MSISLSQISSMLLSNLFAGCGKTPFGSITRCVPYLLPFFCIFLIFINDYLRFNPKISLASSEVATSLPNSFAKRTTLATNSPFDFAKTPLDK